MTDGIYELPLYVTEAEIAKRMGVGIHSGAKALQQMRQHPRFPPKTIGGKRYWPSVVDFLDLWNHRSASVRTDPAVQDYGEQALDDTRAWARLQAMEERLGRRPDRALASDPELQDFLAKEEVRMAEGGRRRPGMEATMVGMAESRLKRKLTPRTPLEPT
jgi:hypothetical protein